MILPGGCQILKVFDRCWHYPQIAKVINAGWNEGDLRWRVLPRNQHALVQATSPVDTSTGLLNNNCSVLPVVIFTTDHKAGTIESIVSEIKATSGKIWN